MHESATVLITTVYQIHVLVIIFMQKYQSESPEKQLKLMGKSQIPVLHKILKSFILKSQIQWPKSKSQI